MNIEAFVLCDAATDSQGKLNVLGAFDTICAKETPITHRACSVALRMRFTKIEEGEHAIKISVVDADGKTALPPMTGNVKVGMSDDASSKAVNLILNIQGLRMENYGEYQINLAVDNRQEASLPFYLRQLN